MTEWCCCHKRKLKLTERIYSPRLWHCIVLLYNTKTIPSRYYGARELCMLLSSLSQSSPAHCRHFRLMPTTWLVSILLVVFLCHNLRHTDAPYVGVYRLALYFRLQWYMQKVWVWIVWIADSSRWRLFFNLPHYLVLCTVFVLRWGCFVSRRNCFRVSSPIVLKAPTMCIIHLCHARRSDGKLESRACGLNFHESNKFVHSSLSFSGHSLVVHDNWKEGT